MLPFAETARFFVIVMMTWLIGFGGFPHVVAGAVEAFFLVSKAGTTWHAAVASYLLPALIGNVLGGVAPVAVVNHAQVVS
jgi:formate-nitrite transporter family protein